MPKETITAAIANEQKKDRARASESKNGRMRYFEKLDETTPKINSILSLAVGADADTIVSERIPFVFKSNFSSCVLDGFSSRYLIVIC